MTQLSSNTLTHAKNMRGEVNAIQCIVHKMLEQEELGELTTDEVKVHILCFYVYDGKKAETAQQK